MFSAGIALGLGLILSGQLRNLDGSLVTPACADGKVAMVVSGGWGCGDTGGGSTVPTGAILLIASGSCPAGYAEETALDGKTLIGTLAANGNVGTTGGSDTVTPAGTNSGGAVSAHAGSAVTAHTYTPAGTIAWPGSVPAFTGSALATHAHELPFQIPTTTTTRQLAAATFGTGTSRAATAVSAAGTANTTSAAVALSEAKSAGTPAGTVAWPGAVPTLSGTQASLTHTVTQPDNHTFTQPSFTGTSFDNRSAFARVIFCKKT